MITNKEEYRRRITQVASFVATSTPAFTPEVVASYAKGIVDEIDRLVDTVGTTTSSSSSTDDDAFNTTIHVYK